MKLSVVVPAYNEEENIKNCLEQLTSYLIRRKCDYEIIVSEDGSTDDTYRIAKEFAKRNKKVKVLHSKKRLGKGAGLIRGLRKAKGDIILFVDGDLPVKPFEIGKLISVINRGNDLAIGSRGIKGSRTIGKSISRRIASKGFNVLINSLFGLDIGDAQCGVKAFTREALRKILPKLTRSGFEIDAEMLLRAKEFGLKVKEVPITWYQRKKREGLSLIEEIVKMGLGIFNLWIKENFDRTDVLFLSILILSLIFSLPLLGSIPDADEGTHNLLGLFYHDLMGDWLMHPSFSFEKIYGYVMSYLVHYPKLSLYHPPLFHLTLSFFYRIFGISFFSGALLSRLFFLATILLTYLFGRKFLNKRIGFIAAIFLSVSPTLFFLSIKAMSDIPLFFFFLLSIFSCLVALENKKRKYFIYSSIPLALGLLTKWIIALVIPVIFIYTIIWRRKQILNILLSFFLVAAILFPYFLLIWKFDVLQLFVKSSMIGGGYEEDPQFTSLSGWLYYPKILSDQYLTLPLFLLSMIGLIYYAKKKQRFYGLFLIWFFMPYLFFTFLPNKEPRYILIALPVLLFSISWLLLEFKKQIVKVCLIVLFFGLMFLSLQQMLSEAFKNRFDFDSVVKETISEEGNILFLSEHGFYSSSFMFRLSYFDRSFSKYVFRPCVLDAKTIEEMLQNYSIKYVIVAQPKVQIDKSNLKLVKVFESDDRTVEVYKNLRYKHKQASCNYICLLDDWICSNYTIPRQALM